MIFYLGQNPNLPSPVRLESPEAPDPGGSINRIQLQERFFSIIPIGGYLLVFVVIHTALGGIPRKGRRHAKVWAEQHPRGDGPHIIKRVPNIAAGGGLGLDGLTRKSAFSSSTALSRK